MNNKKKNETVEERRKYIRLLSGEVLNCKKFSGKSLNGQDVEKKVSSVIKNLSAGGVLFESNVKYEVGTLLQLEINIPGWEKFKNQFYKDGAVSRATPLVVLASVVRLEVIKPDSKYEIGACFSAIDEGHRWAIIKYIKSKK